MKNLEAFLHLLLLFLLLYGLKVSNKHFYLIQKLLRFNFIIQVQIIFSKNIAENLFYLFLTKKEWFIIEHRG